jgi:hypothetical protein
MLQDEILPLRLIRIPLRHSLLTGAANPTRAHASLLSLFRIGKEQDPCTIYACAGSATWFAVNFRSSVTPNCASGNARRIAVHRKTLAMKQLQFARRATAVSADSSVRRNHAMAGNVYRHGIVVQRIAHRPRATCGPHSGAQRLVADQRAARDRLEFVEDLLLERISCKSQVDILT